MNTAALLDFYLERERELLPYERSTDYWTASSLGMCLRRQYLERLGVPPLYQPDKRALRRFMVGNIFHDRMQEMYRECGVAIGIEVPVKDHERQLSCRIDAIVGVSPSTAAGVAPTRDGVGAWNSPSVRAASEDKGAPPSPEEGAGNSKLEIAPTPSNPDPRQTFVVKLRSLVAQRFPMNGEVVGEEIKTATPFAMNQLPKEGPYPHHMVQLAACKIAADADPDQLPALVTRWRLTYIGLNFKDSFLSLEFPLTDTAVADAEQRLVTLNTAWATKEPPPCTCAEGWQSRFCSYRTATGCCEVPE